MALGLDRTQNALLIGWDGTRRETVQALLAAGQLPNLRRLIEEGGMTPTQVTTSATQTKPGWAEILTGRNADEMGIRHNKIYKPIPLGATIFEIIKARDPNRSTIMLAAKLNHLGARGPHEICINCMPRMPPIWEQTWPLNKDMILAKTRTSDGKPRRWVWREGEPYFNAVEAIDLYRQGLGQADKVGKEAERALDRYHESRFFAFFHFEDPDEQGHRHKEGSKEYRDAIITCDRWLGTIVGRMKSLKIYDRTAVFVTTDHGMDEGEREHHDAPNTFLATNLRVPLRVGDRKDITPTILEALGINPGPVGLKMAGRSLILTR